MNWDDLRLFLEVARRETLAEAALQLRQDATTVSRRIRRLETELGQTLFERRRRGHVLSAAGDEMLKRVEAMETAASEIEQSSTAAADLSGLVRLGATEGLGVAFLAPALSEFAALYPRIRIDLIALSGLVSVPKKEADMSILLTRPDAGRLRVRKLSDYSLNLYANKEYLGRSPSIQNKQDLQRHKLIGYVEDMIYSSQLRYFDEVLAELKPSLCSSSINVQHQLIRQGAGVGVLPKFMGHTDTSLEVVLEKEINITRSFWLVVHEDVATLARIKVMKEFLVHLFRSESDRLGAS